MTAASAFSGVFELTEQLQWSFKYTNRLVSTLWHLAKSNVNLFSADGMQELGLRNPPTGIFCQSVHALQQSIDVLVKQFP